MVDPRAGTGSQSRWVLHVDMDAFFASCEQLTRPTLSGRPVLVGGTGVRGVVAGCSYEARSHGARSAMPMHQARRLVGPAAVVVPPRGVLYRELSRRVFALVRSRVPVVEQVSIDEAFLEPPELRGASPEETRQWAQELRFAVRSATGLACSVGAGAGKHYAKIASGLAKPDGVRVVPRRDHREVFDPLPVRALWGVGPVAAERLARCGARTVGDLAALRDEDIAHALGRTVGPAIAAVARGYDDQPVRERDVAKQISAESTFATDLTTAAQVGEAVRRAAGAVHRRLLADGRAARTVTVKIKRSDFTAMSRSITLAAATTSLETITAAAMRLAPDPVDFGAVRLLGVGMSGLTDILQEPLFADPDVHGVAGSHRSAAPIGDGTELPDTSRPAAVLSTDETEEVDHHLPDPGPVTPVGASREEDTGRFRTGSDVRHVDHGFGWVQGCGHGRVTVRFETVLSGPGRVYTFDEDDPGLGTADPLDALDG